MVTRSPLTLLALFLALPAAGFDAEVLRERDASEVRSQVEAAFLAKYGFVQRVMSGFRLREPSLLELEEVER